MTDSVQKSHTSTKSPSTKAAVVIERANGKSKSQIARDLGLHRNTVTAIINEADLDNQMRSGKLGCAALIPKSVQVVENRLDKNDLQAALAILNPLVLKPDSANSTQTTNISYTFVALHGREDAP